MINLLVKLLPMVLSMTISEITYLKIDGKYNVTNKISSKLPIKQEWKAFFCICCAMISMLVIGIIGIYIIEIGNTLYNIISGILIGIGISISIKLSDK